ncbi:clathrin light chain isoform X5 [Tribolium castaneum]|uniref:clathrin light chain isoform X5 n=1 Tax=Tribolium castaneum TaxID=7070 RepID=UPI00077DD90B|nr:PREDICTED: clathrin light chain isoform X5 [Tribolium castaneum]|eukprot:XP_015834774.1 PREDICTED: clathrin light chain isoform X5 [Tribolium castaneum]
MSNFGDAFDQPEVDPAAEFLAREQDDLAGLEDEVKPAAISAPVVNGDAHLKAENDKLRGVSPSPPPLNREVREEPEKIKKWREEQIKRLEEKDAEEEKKKLELREIARKELEEWYKNHEEAIAKTKAANRDAAKNAEKQFVAEDDEIVPGTEWERIAKLCDFNPKAKQGSKDVSRMRSIVLQLKQSPIPINNKA